MNSLPRWRESEDGSIRKKKTQKRHPLSYGPPGNSSTPNHPEAQASKGGGVGVRVISGILSSFTG
jgi:hypothetical protein